jgi:hypothetical protein
VRVQQLHDFYLGLENDPTAQLRAGDAFTLVR